MHTNHFDAGIKKIEYEEFKEIIIEGGNNYDNGVYTNVQLTGGSGNGAKADITVTDNSVTDVNIISTGSNNYTNGDVLTASIPNGNGFTYTLGTNVDGIGENATANITVSAGVVTSVEIANRGSNYLDGQIVLVDGFIGVKLKISFIDSTIYYDGGTKKSWIYDI